MMKAVAVVLAMLLCSAIYINVAGAVDAPHYDTTAGNVCSTCHTVQQTLGSTGYNNICLTCHRPGDPAAGGKPLTLADQANPFGNHSSTGITRIYQTSHRWDGSDTNLAAGAQPPLQGQMTSNGLRSRAGNQLACVRCHNQHDKGADGKFLRMPNNADQLCLDCHRSRNVQSHTSGSHPVAVVYNNGGSSFKSLTSATASTTQKSLNSNLKSGNVSCSTCHGVHFTDSRSSTADGSDNFANLSTADGFLLRADRKGANPGVGNDVQTLCSSCHANKLSHNKNGQNIQCSDCHGAHVAYDPNDPNGSRGINQLLIRRSVDKGTSGSGTIFFTYTAGRLEYKNPQGTGVCQGCHAVPTATDNADMHAKATATAQDCSACHTHAAPQNVAGAGSFSSACGGCHATPPNGTPVNGSDTHFTAGSHAIHVGNNSIAFCQTCHTPPSSANHKNGTINFNAEISAGFNAAAKTCSTASCHTPYATVVVTTPTWGSSGAGCVTCHNGIGAFTSVGASPATGSHAAHLSHSQTVSCADCHSGAVANNAGGSGHVNGTITVANGYPANVARHAPGTYSGTCSTTCHSTTTAAATTPTWGSAATCWSCHDSRPTTGNHTVHLNSFASCADCHAGATEDVSGGSSHLNNLIDVSNGYPANVAKHAAGVFTGSCSAASCHANPYDAVTPSITPVWGSSSPGRCAACHNGSGAFTGVGQAPVTGSHTRHMALSVTCASCHAGAVVGVNGGSAHKDGLISVGNGYPANTAKHAVGAYSGSCSTAVCHGSASPVWGANSANDFCTKCHGTAALTVTAQNRYLVAPAAPAGADTGSVSANIKTGAHQTHLRLFNGFNNYSSVDYRCEACHGALPTANTFSHADGSASPQGKFQKIATNWGKMSAPVYSAGTNGVGGSCANTYCHNPAGSGGALSSGNAGTSTTPVWNDAAYIADGARKTLTNCNKCHKVPGEVGFTGANHGAITIASACIGCHGHEGDSQGSVGRRHMDGIKYGGGTACNSCHGYPPLSPADFAAKGTDFVDGSVEDYLGGGGHHAVHLLPTITIGDTFTPCLPCHPSTNHQQGGATVLSANVNVNDPADTSYRFDSDRAKRYDAVAKTCANVSCHFQPTTSW